MRLTISSCKNFRTKPRLTRGPGRAPQDPNKVPFRELLPLQLKNKVSAKGEKSTDPGCIQDMAVMFACLKDNNFTESACEKEIKTFKECYNKFMEQRFLAKKQAASGEIPPHAKTLPSRSLNKLLRKYPQVNDPTVKVKNA